MNKEPNFEKIGEALANFINVVASETGRGGDESISGIALSPYLFDGLIHRWLREEPNFEFSVETSRAGNRIYRFRGVKLYHCFDYRFKELIIRSN